MLDFVKVDEMIKKTGVQCLPVRNSLERKYFEYACNMEIRLKKEEYVDFVRSITPIIVDLFELILKKRCQIKIDNYCEFHTRNGKKRREWSKKKLENTRVLEILNDRYGKFDKKDIYSSHLEALIEGFERDEHVCRITKNVRSIEDNIRNLAAHEIISVTEEAIKKLTGFSSSRIMEMIKELFEYAGLNIKKEYWDTYDEMNQIILSRI